MSMNTESETNVSLKARAGDTSGNPSPSAPSGVSSSTSADPKKKGFDPALRKKVGIGIGAVAAVLLGYFLYESYEFVSTDNAQVGAPSTLLSAKVSGIIVKANVEENQKVKAGDVLVEIKPDDYQNVVDQLEADGASYQAQLKAAQSNYERTVSLFHKGASTQERLDTAEAQFKSAQGKLKAAEAEANEAKLNLGYTKIVAPVDGKVGKKSFEVGMLAAAGQPLLGFVANNERWVTANLKETDMDSISEGKKASVDVDAISGKTFDGVVESISPATGATFTLLPPDNATGNFTKVVQRVPVRIKLLNLTEKEIDRLQNGLSAEVKIHVH
jgi:membrane fusion protein (multidrug efflux system)